MTDLDLVRKKLAFIETCVAEIRQLGRPDAVERDVRELRFLVYTLQTAIQAILDVAGHVVSSERMGEPDSNRELVRLLVRREWIPERLGKTLVLMVGFRNVRLPPDVTGSLLPVPAPAGTATPTSVTSSCTGTRRWTRRRCARS